MSASTMPVVNLDMSALSHRVYIPYSLPGNAPSRSLVFGSFIIFFFFYSLLKEPKQRSDRACNLVESILLGLFYKSSRATT
jgi:hypothetical protein